VGDSRAYLLRGSRDRASRLNQITEDHIYGNLVAAAGNVPNLAARLSRFLDGRIDGRSPDLTACDLRPEDRFLLCSDGLSAVVPIELIHEAMKAPTGPGETADRLITLANDRGGPDNISVIVIDVRAKPI
jgi:PPM family protein phosphatase